MTHFLVKVNLFDRGELAGLVSLFGTRAFRIARYEFCVPACRLSKPAPAVKEEGARSAPLVLSVLVAVEVVASTHPGFAVLA
jgi:hypothetical protein